ncbi:MAG: thermonuclease family protein [Dysgonomonas sp.]
MIVRRLLFFLLTVILLSCDPAVTDKFVGEVVKVADGDTFTVKTVANKRIKIRLYGIDAPERGQDYGSKSRQFLNDLCYGKEVSIVDKGTDQYGRTLGIAYIGDLNINEEMVRNGLAWYYNYSVDDARLESLEKDARNKKLNIWSMKNPISPYEYRKNKRK